MREREGSQRAYPIEREHNVCALIWERGRSIARMHICWASYMLHRGGPCLVVQERLVQCVLSRELERVGSSTCCNILKQRWNNWNIRLQHVYNHCNICNMQIKTLAIHVWNGWNFWNIHLQHTCIATATYATSRWNTCNICLKQLKYLKHTLATHVYCHYNICNIRSTFATFR